MKNWKVWILVGITAVLGIFVLTGCGKKQINLNDYITYSFHGYDGYGSLDTSIDSKSLESAVAEAMGIKMENVSDLFSEEGTKLLVVEDALGQGIHGSWEQTEDLSNGDKVVYHFDVNEEQLKVLDKVAFRWRDIEDKVSGLEEVGEFDPFEGMTVSASGYDTLGSLSYQPSEDYSLMDYSVNKTDDLSNGDVVTISFTKTDPEQNIYTYGGVPSRTEMEYTVEGLEEIGEFDPFEDMVVTGIGYDSQGHVSYTTEKYKNLYFYATPSSGLSNGDEVTITLDEPDTERLVNLYGGVPTRTEMKYTVQGLEEITEFDPFEGLELIFTGTEPYGTLESVNSDYPNITYYTDKNSNLSNGDTIRIYIEDTDPKWMLDMYGGIPSRTEMEYTVDGVTEYIKSLEDIPEDLETNILNQVKDVVYSWYTDDTRTLQDYQVLGYYLLTPKGDTNGTHNQLYVVYKAGIHEENGNENVTAYKYIKFHDLIKYADGTGYVDIMDYTNPVVPGWSYYGDEGYYFTSSNGNNYAGFTNLATLENQCINSQKAGWYVESNIEDSELSSASKADALAEPSEGTSVKYITKLEEIPEILDNNMKQQLKDQIDSIVANYNNSELLDYEVLGEYLLTPKGTADYNNMLYIVCKADIRSYKGEDTTEDITAYLYIRFTDLMLYEDGTGYVDLMRYDYSSPYSDASFQSPLNLNYAGYSSLNLLENQCIASRKADWNVEYKAEEAMTNAQDTSQAGAATSADEQATKAPTEEPEITEDEIW